MMGLPETMETVEKVKYISPVLLILAMLAYCTLAGLLVSIILTLKRFYHMHGCIRVRGI
ncbi:hypothetical protein ES702_07192 [subsurface metagenome]